MRAVILVGLGLVYKFTTALCTAFKSENPTSFNITYKNRVSYLDKLFTESMYAELIPYRKSKHTAVEKYALFIPKFPLLRCLN
jgi:hypothetical protein